MEGEKNMYNGDERELICIRCPVGCMMTVSVFPDGAVDVRGNSCGRGEEYAKKEITDPTRIVTSTVPVKGGTQPVVPVKTKRDIPKGKVMECMSALKKVVVEAPVYPGDVILANAAETGIDVIAVKHVDKAG